MARDFTGFCIKTLKLGMWQRRTSDEPLYRRAQLSPRLGSRTSLGSIGVLSGRTDKPHQHVHSADDLGGLCATAEARMNANAVRTRLKDIIEPCTYVFELEPVVIS